MNFAGDDRRRFVADLASRYGRRLRGFLAVRLRNSADIADLAQEVFLRLLRAERHEQIRNPEAYLLTIASHVIHQHTLESATVPQPLDPMDEEFEAQLGEDSDPVAQLHLERRLEALERCLAKLSPNAKAAFLLQRRDGCTLDEIAAQLGVSRGMVKKYLARAIVQCARHVQEGG